MKIKRIIIMICIIGLFGLVPIITSCSYGKGTSTQDVGDTNQTKDEKIDFLSLGLKLNPETFVYDGTSKCLQVTGNIPSDLSVSYTGSGTNVGEYTVKAHFVDNGGKYKNVTDLEAKMIIEKADYDLSNVNFNDMIFDYDGESKSASIQGNLPKGLNVTFEGDGKTEIGEYEVIAHFFGDEQNYNKIQDKKAKLIINKGNDYHYVTFNDENGKEISKKLVKHSEPLTDIPLIPFKEGYTGTWNYSFDSITDEMTCVPSYVANKYTVTYDVNGGNSLTSNTQEVTYDSNAILSIPTREGYTFAGWYNDDALVEDGVWSLANDVTLTASWTANKYKITYDVNGGNSLTSNTQEVTYDSNVTLAIPTFERYTFAGWYYGNTLVENGKWIIPNDIKLVANWVGDTYEITYVIYNYEYSTKVNYGDTITLLSDLSLILPVAYVSSFELGNWTLDDTEFEPNSNFKYTFDKDITLSSCVTLIDSTVFKYTLSDTTASIDSYLLIDRETNIIIPTYIKAENIIYDVKSISRNAFRSTMITSVTIPEGVIQIKQNSFTNCSNLAKVYLPSTLVIINESGQSSAYGSPFSNCPLLTSTGPVGSGKSIEFAWTEKITFDTFAYLGLEEIILPDTITTIDDYAFCGSKITSIELPSSLVTIGRNAFSQCTNLKTIIIPEGVTKIGLDAFKGCTKLAKVYLPSTLVIINGSGYSSTYKSPFYDCPLLTSTGPVGSGKSIEFAWKETIPANAFKNLGLEEIILPDTITTIGNYAFYGSKITSIKLPSSLVNINYCAFGECTNLENVYYLSSEVDKSLISINSNNTNLINAKWYYYLEFEPVSDGNYWHYDDEMNITIWGLIS